MSHITAAEVPRECFAVATPGLETLVADELTALRGSYPLEVGESEPGGVSFRTDDAGLYAANLHLRIATRVLVRIGVFRAANFHELERHAARLPWRSFVAPEQAVEFRVTARKSRLYHQGAVTQRLRASVASAVAGAGAPGAGGSTPQEFVVRLFRDTCTVSVDASGELLHRRGYRLASSKAPLRETLAAAMVMASGWDGLAPLVDPLCGSGTIPIEAALLARRIPPGLGREFAFMRWPEYHAKFWAAVVDRARSRILPRAGGPIVGSDRDAGAVKAATANAERAGVAKDIEWRRAAISSIAVPPQAGWIVTNPPYGVRVGERRALRDLYAQLGNVARRCCPGWKVALLAAHPELERQIGLVLASRFATENGGIRVRMVQGMVVPATPVAAKSL
ncbi:MAG TPA: class I SAM-dependent RNA methyltransferase [Gemmatimonadales bacterium]|nr:class I SAM-dependent RNA methyltransferase [Gemmatimonadales bacterium]